MERLEAAHASINGLSIIMNVGSPTFGDMRRSGIESIVPLVIEGNSFERVLSSLDIGARPNAIILEED